jgi:SAM-dependent methyltransferase
MSSNADPLTTGAASRREKVRVAGNKGIAAVLGRGPIHPFPARMAPSIALGVLADHDEPLRVLDPMMGSGTVLAVARSRHHHAIGMDIDPLAVLIARAWTQSVDATRATRKARDVLRRARAAFKALPVRQAYPPNADEETRRFITYWFDGYARRQLTALASTIARVHDQHVRAVLWVGFSRLIITKQSGASRAMDLAHSRPHRRYLRAPIKPFRRFLSAVDYVVRNCIHHREPQRGPRPAIRMADARALPVPSASIDLVITSPPYLNAIDYLRCSKFTLVWMGYSITSLRAVRAESVGSEVGQTLTVYPQEVHSVLKALRLRPALSRRDEAILARYAHDMRSALGEIARVLKPAGKAVIVIGENTIRGTFLRNAALISSLAVQAGLQLHSRRSRLLPMNRRYLPPPRRAGQTAELDGRIRREVILAFTKANNTE